ncbi:MAG: hypothetical protein HN368_18115 [Spirochaetales bacterium]|jgi:hypothetical protein|nr:hypothetical protein [Spirochaetales bacterium]
MGGRPNVILIFADQLRLESCGYDETGTPPHSWALYPEDTAQSLGG